MFVSESDMAQVMRTAVSRAAEVVGLDPELMSTDEILEVLTLKHASLARTFGLFEQAYRDWFGFHQRIHAAGRAGHLTRDETAELHRLVESKEQARRNLIALVEFPSQTMASTWLNSVLSPLEAALSVSIPRLEQRQWTWRFHSRSCELIRPLSPTALLLRSKSILLKELHDSVDEHDLRLARFLASLNGAQEALQRNPALITSVESCLEKHRVLHPSDAPWGAFAPEKLVNIVAQFLINRVQEVEQGTTTMYLFWNEFRTHLEASMDPAVLTHVDYSGGQLLEASKAAEGAILEVKDRLVRRYGLAA